MPELYIDRDRYGEAPASPLVEAVHNLVRDLVRSKLHDSGEAWNDFVFGSSDGLLTKADFEIIERRILDTGYRFAWSSMLSARDRPEIYLAADGVGDDPEFSFEHPDAQTTDAGLDGRAQCGTGDNVVRRSANTVGTAYYVRTSERVIELMEKGVPPDMIAIIDDSGGTLTAPILEHFSGVICAGGTVRSHLGILTREYGIPCMMNAKISGIREGDRVEIESSALARTSESYQAGVEMSAKIWKLA